MISSLKLFVRAAGLVVAAGLFAGCSARQAEPAPTAVGPSAPRETFRVMTWNLEHFVDPFNDPYIDSPTEDEAKTKPEEVLQLIVDTVRAENPAVIVFTEVESDRAINLMFNSFWPGHPYKYYAAAESPTWYQNVAIASRFPISTFTSFREAEITNPLNGRVENKYNSRLITADITAPGGYEFTVAGLHLKAMSDEENAAWRKEQVKLVATWFEREHRLDPERNILALGDMNFPPLSEEYLLFLDGTAVKFEDTLGRTVTPYTLPGSDRWPPVRFDHIFASRTMMPEYVPGSARVLDGDALRTVSDHFPVVADFYAGDR